MAEDNTFTLSIDMIDQSIGDVCAILVQVAERLADGDFHPGHTRSILHTWPDGDGSRIGSYRVPPSHRFQHPEPEVEPGDPGFYRGEFSPQA